MTKASKWRIALARRIVPIYANHPKVKAVIVGGSVGRGIATSIRMLKSAFSGLNHLLKQSVGHSQNGLASFIKNR